MNITFEGREWPYDEDTVTVQQAIAMHFAYGFTLKAWIAAIPELDPRALQCCYWLMLQQSGEKKPLKDCEFDLVDFISAYAEAQKSSSAKEEPAAEDEPETIPFPQGGQPSAEPSLPPRTRARRQDPTGS